MRGKAIRHGAAAWLIAVVMGGLATAAVAATAETPPTQAPPVQALPPPAPPAPPPYEPQLLRLSELMGALHYLRGLCGFDDAPAWRDKMKALMNAQSLDDAGRAQFAGAFNRGFRTFSETYRTCSEAANGVIRAYLDESAAIAKALESRYGH